MGLILAVSTEPGGRQSDAIQRRLMAERRRWRPTGPHPSRAMPGQGRWRRVPLCGRPGQVSEEAVRWLTRVTRYV
jgi:hypothetical protein